MGSNQRKVAFYLPTFTPGGIEQVLLTLAREFTTRGIHVDILVADKRGPYKKQIPNDGKIIDLGTGRVAYSLLPVVRYLHQQRPDVLFSGHTHANIICTCASLLSRTDVTSAVSVHTAESVKRYDGIRSRVIRRLIPLTYRQADQIIAVSDSTANSIAAFAGLSQDKITVIHNPVPQPQEDINTNVHPWINANDQTVILGAGRLASEKDFPTLISAFERVHDVKPDARLIILGKGDERLALERLIKQRNLSEYIDLQGYVENPTPYMHGADVFVLSSRREGFGLVLAEAMAVGTPVVSTDCPTGPADILGNGEYGKLTPVGDARSMATAIDETLNDPLPSEKLKRAIKEYAPSKVASEYLDVFYRNDDEHMK